MRPFKIISRQFLLHFISLYSEEDIRDEVHPVESSSRNCSFLTYTAKLRNCFQDFFSSLRRRRVKCQ